MYEEFLRTVLAYINAMNAADKEVAAMTQDKHEAEYMFPYLGRIPLCMEDGLVGFLVDEVGGVWSYQPATEEDRAWWELRPRRGVKEQ